MPTFYDSKTNIKLLLAFVMIWAALPMLASAEQTKTDICEGLDFWFALPYTISQYTATEYWSDAPAVISITARQATKVFVESGDGVSIPKTEYNIPAGGVQRVKLSEDMFLAESDNEKASNKGIHISSQEPVSVVAYVAYRFSGESFRIYPSEWLGSRYYTINLYQDKFADVLCPSEFVVVATEDGTSVTYTPKVTTGKVSAGSSKSILMRKGQSLLVVAKTNDAISWNTERSDLSGSLITSNKPVAVISGHSKASFPQLNNKYYGLSAEGVRNLLCEMLPPVEHCGKEFVVLPFNTPSRDFEGLSLSGTMLRFVAVEDGTIVKKAFFNQETKQMEYLNASNTMAAGEVMDVVYKMDGPAYFVSNKPILAGLYCHSFLRTAPAFAPVASYNYYATGGLLYCVPVERWVSKSIISIETANYTNYLYLMFRNADMDKLFYNGQSFSVRFGSSATSIQGTPYSFMILPVAPGLIDIFGTDSARFSAFYSNENEEKDGRFYTTQIGYNYAHLCSDSLSFAEQTNCGTTNCSCRLIATGADTSCLEFFHVKVAEEDTMNYSFTPSTEINSKLREYKFSLSVVDASKPAYAKVQFFTKSGLSDFREYSYSPRIPEIDCKQLDFGFKNPGDSDTCMDFHVINSQSYPLVIGSIDITRNHSDFRLDMEGLSFPLQLGPGESLRASVRVSPRSASKDWIRDTVIVSNECFQTELPIFFANKQSIAQISDIDFGKVIAGSTPSISKLNIKNAGQYSMQIDSMKFADGTVFSFVDTVTYPIYISAGSNSTDFHVRFSPKAIKAYSDTIRLYSNALPGKLMSYLSGIGIATSTEDSVGVQMVSAVPSTTDDMFHIRFDTPNGFDESSIELFDVLGNRIKLLHCGPVGPGQQTLNVSMASLSLGSGLYIVRVETKEKTYIMKVMLKR